MHFSPLVDRTARALAGGLVEEAVRWASPVKTFMRSATPSGWWREQTK
jgi:cytochrome P450